MNTIILYSLKFTFAYMALENPEVFIESEGKGCLLWMDEYQHDSTNVDEIIDRVFSDFQFH